MILSKIFAISIAFGISLASFCSFPSYAAPNAPGDIASGMRLYNLRKFHDAHEVFRRCALHNSDPSTQRRALYLQATCEYQTKELVAAELSFKKVIARFPQTEEANLAFNMLLKIENPGVAVNVAQNSIDRSSTANIARHVIQFSEPLPKDWEYLMAAENKSMTEVSFSRKNPRLIVQFMTVANTKHLSVSKLIDAPEFQTHESPKGTLTRESSDVGLMCGRPMAWVRTSTSTDSATTGSVEYDVVSVSSDKAILIALIQPNGAAFDRAQFQPIISMIKGFSQ